MICRISFQKTIIKLKEEAKAQDAELDKLTKKAFKNLLPSIAIQKLKKGVWCLGVSWAGRAGQEHRSSEGTGVWGRHVTGGVPWRLICDAPCAHRLTR